MKILSKSFGKKLILENISFSVSEGEKIAIIGRNGAGKTTLLKIMAGIQKADKGEVSYFNDKIDLSELKIAFLPQSNPLIQDLSIRDNVWLWNENRNSIDEILKKFDLQNISDDKVKKISGGMQRRVAIACVMQNKPRVLILDEPTASLDMVYKKEIREIIESFSKEGVAVIYSTHDLEEIAMADKIMLIKNKTLNIVDEVPKDLRTIYKLIE